MRPMAEDPARERTSAASGRGWTVRMRVLTTMLAFMAVGLALTGVLTYVAQFRALDHRVTSELWQEYDELALIAAATDDSGAPVHTTVDSVLVDATDSVAPWDYESVITFLNGQRAYQPRSQDYDLVQPDPPGHERIQQELLDAHRPGEAVIIPLPAAPDRARVRQGLRDARRPGEAARIPLQAYARELWVLVASVRVSGDESEGVFVVANDVGAQRSALWQSVTVYAGLSAAALLIAGWVGYVVTGQLLRPLEDLRSATEQITVDDLEYRVPVPEERDDISALAQNFNRMLERIQAGFA